MEARSIAENVQWVGAIDWDRRVFDALIPLPDGTSYNAYVVSGTQKTALLDAVDPACTEVLRSRLANAGVQKIDYVVVHHVEQDHSGAIPRILAEHLEAKVLASDKGKSMLIDHLGIAEDRIQVVKDGEQIDLGGLTLKFVYFPWVHWPETMLTWLPERQILFTCDLFGSHLATSELFAKDDPAVLPSAKRYFAELMMPFRNLIEKRLGKILELNPAVIAPSHGPVYEKPSLILDAYREWVSAPPQNLVVVPYISMHDSTRSMVEHFVDACTRRGIRAEQFNLAEPDLGKFAALLVDAATLVFGTPTVLAGPHPQVAYAAFLANALKPKAKYLSVIGSYGWSSRVTEQLTAMVSHLKVEILEPVLCKGKPKSVDFEAIERLVDAIAVKHQSL